MPPTLNSNQRPSALAFILFLTPSPLFAQGMLPPAAVYGETLVLSPFTVQVDTEKGYLATQTLSGTRLKTDLRDIGSALTIFTEQLMDDLGANNINQILNFAPNTDTFVSNLIDVSGNGNDFINIATQYVTRGGATSVVGQDFFQNVAHSHDFTGCDL